MEKQSQMDAIIENRIRNINRNIGGINLIFSQCIHPVASLLQSDVVDKGTGRGVCLGSILMQQQESIDSLLDGIEEQLGFLKKEAENYGQGFMTDLQEALIELERKKGRSGQEVAA